MLSPSELAENQADSPTGSVAAIVRPSRLDSIKNWLDEAPAVGNSLEPLSQVEAGEGGGGGRGTGSSGPDAAAASFLSSRHISPRGEEEEYTGPSVSYAVGGRYVQVKIPGKPFAHAGKKTAIKGFSAKARHALLSFVSSMNQDVCEAAEFVLTTLTYSKAFPTAAASKDHLDIFLKRFEREWGPHGIIWKLEPQTRGAPHFHLLTFMGKGFDLAALLEWTARAWHEIAGGGDRNHFKWHLGQLGNGNRPCVEVVRDWKGVATYAGKYLGKVSQGDEEWQHPGRYWGKRREHLFPIKIERVAVPLRIAALMRRECVRWFERQNTGWFYIPGKPLRSGGHRAGLRLFGKSSIDMGRGERERVCDCVDSLSYDLDVVVRAQRRRWPLSRGGFSGFVPAEMFQRLMKWAEGEASSCVREPDKPDATYIANLRSYS